MVYDKHAKEEFILSTTGRTTTTVYDRGRQPRPPWHCDANREDHMTELDHEVVKRLCDHNATTVEIYKQLNNGHSIAPWFSFIKRFS